MRSRDDLSARLASHMYCATLVGESSRHSVDGLTFGRSEATTRDREMAWPCQPIARASGNGEVQGLENLDGS